MPQKGYVSKLKDTLILKTLPLQCVESSWRRNKISKKELSFFKKIGLLICLLVIFSFLYTLQNRNPETALAFFTSFLTLLGFISFLVFNLLYINYQKAKEDNSLSSSQKKQIELISKIFLLLALGSIIASSFSFVLLLKFTNHDLSHWTKLLHLIPPILKK